MRESNRKYKPAVVGLIPARYGSTRFPGKPLCDIAGKKMIERVYDQSIQSELLDDLYVVTDSVKIEKFCKGRDIRVLMVSEPCKTGTDRIAIAAKSIPSNLYVNIQGDEPLISPESIDAVIDAYDARYGVVNAYAEIGSDEELNDLNVVKAVVGEDNLVRHYSRLPIDHYKQLGLYAMSPGMLDLFSKIKRSRLERVENVEMLRLIDGGWKIIAVKVEDSVSVDVPEDVQIVEDIIYGRQRT